MRGLSVIHPRAKACRAAGARRQRLGEGHTPALDAAMLLFWQKGYEATGVADLTKAMGITPPTLYASFGNRERCFGARSTATRQPQPASATGHTAG
jgi:AcrR family transcriptional regulator